MPAGSRAIFKSISHVSQNVAMVKDFSFTLLYVTVQFLSDLLNAKLYTWNCLNLKFHNLTSLYLLIKGAYKTY